MEEISTIRTPKPTVTVKREESSKDDSSREELLWEEREEKYIRDIEHECRALSQTLEKIGKRKRYWYAIWSIPSMLLPVLAASVNEMAPDNLKYMSSLLMLGSAMCTTINTFFNFGKKSQQFFEHSNKYRELSDDISVELCKPKKYRLDCDLVLQRVSMKRNSIASTCPN